MSAGLVQYERRQVIITVIITKSPQQIERVMLWVFRGSAAEEITFKKVCENDFEKFEFGPIRLFVCGPRCYSLVPNKI